MRPVVVKRAEELNLPVENLISPDALKHLLWEIELPLSVESVSDQLAARDARRWQQDLIAPLVVERLS